MSVPVTQGAGATVAADVYGTPTPPAVGQQVQWVGLAAGAAGALNPLSNANPLPSVPVGDVNDVTLTLDTSAYTSGDVLSDTATITAAVLANGGKCVLDSVTVIDEDDQGVAFDIYFFKATQSLGAKNAAPNISDAAARDCLGYVSVASGDYKDLGGVRVATVRNIGLVLEADAGATSIFLGTVTGGTPTYTANGLRLKLGLRPLSGV